MGPRDSRDLTETNGNVHPAGNGKRRAKISRTSSNASFGDLPSEAMDAGIAAVRQISKILHFVHGYHEEISDVESIYGLGIRQQAHIDELNATVNDLMFRKDQEMTRLRDENDAYRASARQFELEREKLKQDQASMDDTRKAMQSKMKRQKEMEINEAKQEFSDKVKTKVKQVREELEKKIQDLETDKDGLKDAIKKLKEKNTQAQEDLNQQKESLELDKRSSQSHIIRLEAELHQINAAFTVSPQTPEFYIEGFRQLWERIRDVAVNEFRFLPEDTQPLDSDAVRNRLFNASEIFKYSPLSTESRVATSLRACAIQNFLSTMTISIIRRRYFAESMGAVERKSRIQPMDSILDAISNVSATTLSQEVSWQLITVDKLDRLNSYGPSATTDVFTEPSQDSIIDEILDVLHNLRSPIDQRLRVKLTEIISMTIKLWVALRKNSCRIDFDYDPSTGDWQKWDFIDDVATNGFMAADPPSEIPVDQLPSKSFMLFPRITGSFGSDYPSHRILHAGSALPHDSATFQTDLREIEHINQATKEFKRNLRRGSSAQSSPIIGKRQGD